MSEIKTLHDPFARFLRDKGIPFVRARSDRESTIAEGHPDFTLLAHGRALMIEFKTKEGALSKAQVERIAELESAGCKVHVLRDLAKAIELVGWWHSTIAEAPAAPSPTAPRENLRRVGLALYRETSAGLEKVRNLTPAEIASP